MSGTSEQTKDLTRGHCGINNFEERGEFGKKDGLHAAKTRMGIVTESLQRKTGLEIR